MTEWKKISKTVNAEGTTITYSNGGPYTIESRLRHIAHAGGKPGTWDCTSYMVIGPDGKAETVAYRLKNAMALVEKLEAELYHLGPDEPDLDDLNRGMEP